jgi:outer membrane murein-binding lipoprotein Lpp
LYLCKNFLNQYKMKRLFALLVVAGMCFVACGPSAEEKAKEEKRIADSIETARLEAEKIAAEEEVARLEAEKAAAEEEAAKAAAEEEAKTKKTTTAPKQTTKSEEPVKVEPAKPAETPAKKDRSGVKQTN